MGGNQEMHQGKEDGYADVRFSYNFVILFFLVQRGRHLQGEISLINVNVPNKGDSSVYGFSLCAVS